MVLTNFSKQSIIINIFICVAFNKVVKYKRWPMDALENKYGNEIVDFSDLKSRGVSMSFLEVVLCIFVDEVTSHLEKLDNAVDSENHSAVVSSAHAIRGSAANVGAAKLGSCAKNIEDAGRHCDISVVATLLPNLKAEFECTINLFNKIFA